MPTMPDEIAWQIGEFDEPRPALHAVDGDRAVCTPAPVSSAAALIIAVRRLRAASITACPATTVPADPNAPVS